MTIDTQAPTSLNEQIDWIAGWIEHYRIRDCASESAAFAEIHASLTAYKRSLEGVKECPNCYKGRVLVDLVTGKPLKADESTMGATWQPCPDCTEPAPSAEELTKYGQNSVQFYEVPPVDRAIAELRSRIAELSRRLEQAEAVRSDEAFSGALSDELYKKRIAELEAGIHQLASECRACDGKSVNYPSLHDCGACADIRALLPKEST